jgi:hypothetical protein
MATDSEHLRGLLGELASMSLGGRNSGAGKTTRGHKEFPARGASSRTVERTPKYDKDYDYTARAGGARSYGARKASKYRARDAADFADFVYGEARPSGADVRQARIVRELNDIAAHSHVHGDVAGGVPGYLRQPRH